ncbi:hypothetical protein BR93DRAFT_993623 [Coniochaeta sp. PMI_546]|nr:hypothetical protein BR93DRAFT_993623 [Coniochaeta sp. PMI_546]
MASDSSPELQGTAPDKPGHPSNPNLNFIWLYATIAVILVIAVTVKIMTIVFKKRRNKKRDPDLERQQLESFHKWWYPWRYNKKGDKISASTSDGTGESSVPSSQTLVDAPPRLPPLAHQREGGLDRLVYRRSGNITDSPLGSPAIMCGALSPGSLLSPIRLEPMDARLNKSGVHGSVSTASLLSSTGLDPSATAAASFISDGSGATPLPAVNPFTSKPFRSDTPRAIDRPDPSAWTTPTRSASNATGHGHGRLSPEPVEGSRFNSSRFTDGQFGRSLAREVADFKETGRQFLDSSQKSGVSEADFAHGYASSSASGSHKDNPTPRPVPSGQHDRDNTRNDVAKGPQVRDPSQSQRQPDRTTSTRDKPSRPTKDRPSDLRGTPSRSQSSRHAPVSSRTPSSQASLARTPTAPSSSSSRTPNPSSARKPLSTGKFRDVVREDKWSRELREKEAENRKKEAEEAERKRKKQEERQAKGKSGSSSGLRDLVGAAKKAGK